MKEKEFKEAVTAKIQKLSQLHTTYFLACCAKEQLLCEIVSNEAYDTLQSLFSDTENFVKSMEESEDA